MTDGTKMRLALVSEFFRQLDSNGVGHVVLRNHEEVAAGLEKDIDVLISAGNFDTVRRIARESADAHAAKVVLDRVTLGGLYLTIVFPTALDIRPLRLHFNPYVPIHATAAQLRVRGLSTRIRYRQINRELVKAGGLSLWVPSPDWSVLFLSARLLRKNKEKYLQQIARLSGDCRLIQGSTVEMIRNSALRDDAIGLATALKQALRELSPLKLRFRAASEWMSLVTRSVASCFRRHGLIVIFSGPDGAGKSTTTGICTRYLKEDIGAQVHFVKGLAPINNIFSKQLMRTHDRIRGVPKQLSSAEVDLHHRDRAPESGRVAWKARRLLGILFYIAQYWPAYIFARLRNHFGHYVVVDTSVHDRFVKAHRPRFRWLERLFLPTLRTGDLLLQLRADPEKIHARKPELTISEIHDYYAAMDEILQKSRTVRRLHTDGGIPLATQHLKAELVAALARQGI